MRSTRSTPPDEAIPTTAPHYPSAEQAYEPDSHPLVWQGDEPQAPDNAPLQAQTLSPAEVLARMRSATRQLAASEEASTPASPSVVSSAAQRAVQRTAVTHRTGTAPEPAAPRKVMKGAVVELGPATAPVAPPTIAQPAVPEPTPEQVRTSRDVLDESDLDAIDTATVSPPPSVEKEHLDAEQPSRTATESAPEQSLPPPSQPTTQARSGRSPGTEDARDAPAAESTLQRSRATPRRQEPGSDATPADGRGQSASAVEPQTERAALPETPEPQSEPDPQGDESHAPREPSDPGEDGASRDTDQATYATAHQFTTTPASEHDTPVQPKADEASRAQTTETRKEGSSHEERAPSYATTRASVLLEPELVPRSEGAERPVAPVTPPVKPHPEPSAKLASRSALPAVGEEPALQSVVDSTDSRQAEQTTPSKPGRPTDDQPTQPMPVRAVQLTERTDPAATDARLELKGEPTAGLQPASPFSRDTAPAPLAQGRQLHPDAIADHTQPPDEGQDDVERPEASPVESTSESPPSSHSLVSRKPLRRPLPPLLGKRGTPGPGRPPSDTADQPAGPEADDTPKTRPARATLLKREQPPRPSSSSEAASLPESVYPGSSPAPVQRSHVDTPQSLGPRPALDAGAKPDSALRSDTRPQADARAQSFALTPSVAHAGTPLQEGPSADPDLRQLPDAPAIDTVLSPVQRKVRPQPTRVSRKPGETILPGDTAPITRTPATRSPPEPSLLPRHAVGPGPGVYSGVRTRSAARDAPVSRTTDVGIEPLPDPEALWSAPAHRELPLAQPPSPAVRPARAGSGADALQRDDKTSAIQMMQDEPSIQRQTEDSAGGDSEAAAGAEEQPGAGAELETMARKVYDLLRRRLRVEQERAKGWVR